MTHTKLSLIFTFMLTACASGYEAPKPMLLKANFVFNDNAENASYCILNHFDSIYHGLPSTVDQIENGWKIQLKRDQRAVLILVMTNATNQKTGGELYLEQDGYSNQAWIERAAKAALACKGRMTY